jgi:3-oxoacyl-[acyl-carrier protein] reductase
MRLKNKKAIVTGGACGIGKAIAKRFTEEGAEVCILDINDEASSKVEEDIKKAGGRAYSIHCDVGDSKQVDAAFSKAMDFMGGLNILVNNTGVIRQSPVLETSEEDWDFIIRTNLKSVFLCTKKALKEMVDADKGGRIISISSIHSVLSEPNCCHYTASKGGMESFMRTVATEMAPNKITANFIRPGATYTDLTIPMYTKSVKESLYKRIPLAEIAEAEWIANAALFLASDESRYMTGQNMTVDGGFTMDGSLPDAVYWEQ